MIIIPYDNNMPMAGTRKEYYDEFGNRYQDIVSRISINPISKIGRLEKISLMREDDFPGVCIYKECAIGPILRSPDDKRKEAVIFNNYTYSVVDKNTGAYIQSGGYCPNPDDSNGVTAYMCYGENNQLYPEYVDLENENYTKRINESFDNLKFSLDMIDGEVNSYENEYQLSYTETMGFLNTFFSTWTFTYPVECYILIDSVRREFNIPHLKFMNGISDDSIRNIYINLVREVDAACEYLFRVLDAERRHLALRIFLHPFGSVIKIHDYDRKIVDKVNYYNSTQIQSVVKNVRADGLIKYAESEALNILENISLNKPVEQALENCGDIFIA